MDGITQTEIAAGQLGTLDPFGRAALERALAGVPIDDRQARHLLALPDEHTPALLAVLTATEHAPARSHSPAPSPGRT